jgi:hypothetical protein
VLKIATTAAEISNLSLCLNLEKVRFGSEEPEPLPHFFFGFGGAGDEICCAYSRHVLYH